MYVKKTANVFPGYKIYYSSYTKAAVGWRWYDVESIVNLFTVI